MLSAKRTRVGPQRALPLSRPANGSAPFADSRLRRSGLTLLEVVVVVFVIGILMALLIPLTYDSRIHTRRSQCSMHLSNLAKATIQYEMSHQAYPGWLQNYGWFTGTQGDITEANSNPSDFAFHQKVGGWAVTLLPYLDAQPTYEVWTQDEYPVVRGVEYTKSAAPNLAIMQCPQHIGYMLSESHGRNSYVSNNGMHHLLSGGVIPGPLAAEGGNEFDAFARSMKPANGVFNNKFGGPGAATGDAVRADDLKDGLSNTVLFSESMQAAPWHHVRVNGHDSAALLATAPRPDSDEPPSSPANDVIYPRGEARFLHGFVWHWQDDDREVQQVTGCAPVSAVHRINGQGVVNGPVRDIFDIQLADLPIDNIPHVARPSSAHARGVNMSFADGSSRFIAESIDYRVYQALMTPHGSRSDVPMPEFVLTGDDF